MAGQREQALESLDKAIVLGYGYPDAIAADPDLKKLHGGPRFDALMAKARQATAKAQ